MPMTAVDRIQWNFFTYILLCVCWKRSSGIHYAVCIVQSMIRSNVFTWKWIYDEKLVDYQIASNNFSHHYLHIFKIAIYEHIWLHDVIVFSSYNFWCLVSQFLSVGYFIHKSHIYFLYITQSPALSHTHALFLLTHFVCMPLTTDERNRVWFKITFDRSHYTHAHLYAYFMERNGRIYIYIICTRLIDSMNSLFSMVVGWKCLL